MPALIVGKHRLRSHGRHPADACRSSPHIAVKAVGGFGSLDTLLTLHEAGATWSARPATAAILDDFATASPSPMIRAKAGFCR